MKDSTVDKVLPYPLNAWYVAAWDHEITRTILARTIAGRPLALYRTEDGRPVALADACWHRLAPLSLGKLIGNDEIQCPYHGIRYNSAGRCTSMPAQETINPSATVPSFPLVERYRYVWVWSESDFVVTHDDTTVTVSRWMLDINPPPFWRKNMRDKFPGYEGRVDRWQIIHFEAPSTINIDVGVAKAGTGAPEGDRSQGVNGYVMNTITPETDKTCHYFWSFQRNYRLDSQLITTQLRSGVHNVFGEDEAMLAAQQAAIDANPDYEFYSLNIDAGGMWVRRLIERMLEAEGRMTGQQSAGPVSGLGPVRTTGSAA
ncbi:MAG: aromatic ring-hydroxylating dioxygenase subunit alpha [Pseudolysinimonas sp.]